MKIIDTNTVNYILKNGVRPQETYFLAPDVKAESEITEIVLSRRLPPNIQEIADEDVFDEIHYLKDYQYCLNAYRGRSFYNMRGFGDISTLATLKTLGEIYHSQDRRLFADMEERLIVYTEDGPLRSKINQEFNYEGAPWRVQIEDNNQIN